MEVLRVRRILLEPIPYSFFSRVIPKCLIIQAAAIMCQSQRLGAGFASVGFGFSEPRWGEGM